MKNKKKISERRKLDFRMECLKLLSSVTDKILQWSHLKYRLVRNLYCLNPHKMVALPGECIKVFEVVLNKWLKQVGEKILLQMISLRSKEVSFYSLARNTLKSSRNAKKGGYIFL